MPEAVLIRARAYGHRWPSCFCECYGTENRMLLAGDVCTKFYAMVEALRLAVAFVRVALGVTISFQE